MKRQFWGTVLIALGVMVFLQVQHIYNFGLAFWPVVWTLIGLSILWSSFRRVSWFGLALGLWLSAMGLTDILYNAGISPIQGDDILRNGWPVVLVAIGASMIFGKSSWRFVHRWDRHMSSNNSVIGEVRLGPGRWTLDKDLNLSHGIGDLRVDLTTADISEGHHKIHVESGIGDVVVRVPDNVTVIATGKVGLGDLEVLGSRRSGVGNTLTRTIDVPGSTVTLEIEAKLGMGDLDIVQRPVSVPTFSGTFK